MFRALLGTFVLAALAIGCGGTETAETVTDPEGQALKLNVSFVSQSGELSFLTPSNTIVTRPESELVGKPYLIATFEAGFASGSDAPIDYEWGEIPDGLSVSYSTPSTYEDGPYDIVFVGYLTTEITADIKSGAPQEAPPAKGGDIASFTLSTDQIHEGDPKNPPGTIRLNVEGKDASIALENRTPQDPNSSEEVFAAFTDTVLLVP